MMEKEKEKASVFGFVLVLCSIIIIIIMSVGVGAIEGGAGSEGAEEEMRGRGWVEEALVDAISVFTVTSAAPPCATPTYFWYWEKVRRWVVDLDGVLAYLFPPEIDFRAGNGNEKVKEAVSKSSSFDQGRQMVQEQDSPKAAADIAGEL